MNDTSYAVLGEFIRCRHHRACLQSLLIKYEGHTYHMGHNRKLKVDDISKPLPYADWGKIYIYISSPHHMEAILRNGITVLWDGKKTAEITVPGSFFGNTLGKLKLYLQIDCDIYMLNIFFFQTIVQCCKHTLE